MCPKSTEWRQWLVPRAKNHRAAYLTILSPEQRTPAPVLAPEDISRRLRLGGYNESDLLYLPMIFHMLGSHTDLKLWAQECPL